MQRWNKCLFYLQANIVAQTKIHFNEQQLLLLMHQHLMAKGLSKTAESLVQEANLNIAEKKSAPFTYVSHCRVSITFKMFKYYFYLKQKLLVILFLRIGLLLEDYLQLLQGTLFKTKNQNWLVRLMVL